MVYYLTEYTGRVNVNPRFREEEGRVVRARLNRSRVSRAKADSCLFHLVQYSAERRRHG